MHRPEPIASSLKSGLDICEIAGFGERTGGKRTGGRVEIFALFFFLLHIFAGKGIRRHFFKREGGRTYVALVCGCNFLPAQKCRKRKKGKRNSFLCKRSPKKRLLSEKEKKRGFFSQRAKK